MDEHLRRDPAAPAGPVIGFDDWLRADLRVGTIIAVVNFPPRQIGKFLSEVLTLGVPDAEGEVVLLHPEQPVPHGGRLF